MKVLLHTCCAPCSVYCIETLKKENIEITSYWYNPNIHPYKEYKERLNTLKNYNKEINIPLIIDDYYGLKEFCKNVIDKIDNRCGYCYYCRLDKTAKYAKENGFDAFSTTLLISPYQNHELLKKTGEIISKKHGIKFLYKDFRVGFKKGYEEAKKLGLYTQKYCGCIFSEEERYIDEIIKDKERKSNLKLIKPSTMFKNQVMEYKKVLQENNESFNGCALLDECKTFDEWMNFEDRFLEKYKEDYVPSIIYLLVRKSDNKLIGMVHLRLKLNDFLFNYGGNIGYSILPSQRGNGYVKEMLYLLLLKCKKLKMDKILITCDKENIPSQKVILANEGVFENEVFDDKKLSKSGIIQRYWIKIK